MNALQHIRQTGWATMPFSMDLASRAKFAELGNQLIDLIGDDDKLRQAFSFVLTDHKDPRARQANMFAVAPAMHSADDKLWFHVGYQTREHVNQVIPVAEQSQLLKDFLDSLDTLLLAIEDSFKTALTEVGANKLIDDLLPEDVLKRVVHVRVVRYINARAKQASPEPVSGHADMGVCTLHLFETHGNWFHAAPMSQDMLVDDQSNLRQSRAKVMRQQLKLIKENDNNDSAIFFLGAGWKELVKQVPGAGYKDLPVCYHAGIRPTKEVEYISPFANQVLTQPDDRVSLVVFVQPSLQYIVDHDFSYPSVDQIRPKY